MWKSSLKLNYSYGYSHKRFSKKLKFFQCKSYFCEKKKTNKCPAQVILYLNGRKIQKFNHTCRKGDYKSIEEIREYEELSDSLNRIKQFIINGYSYNKMSGDKTKEKTQYFTCVRKGKTRCHGSIHAIISKRQIIKQIGHTCGKASTIISQEMPET